MHNEKPLGIRSEVWLFMLASYLLVMFVAEHSIPISLLDLLASWLCFEIGFKMLEKRLRKEKK